MMRRVRPWWPIALVLVAAGCEEAVITEERLRPIKSLTVQRGDLSTRTRTFTGTTQTAQEVDLSFRVQGTVTTVAVVVGARVGAGSLIATLDDETYRVEFEQAKADLAQARAARRSAEAEYQRVRQLYANDNASRTELDEALADAEASRADYEARAQALRRAELDLSYTRLTADADCSVATVDVDLNENVASGALVATLNCGSNWEVVIDVPESQIAAFEVGLDAIVKFTSIPGNEFSATVTEVGVASSGNSSFPVTLLFNEVPLSMRANLAANVTLVLTDAGGGGDGIVVPPAAVSQDQSGTFVYRVTPSAESGVALLNRQSVEVGSLTEYGLEIVTGLEAGDVILLAGHANARDGMRVRGD